MKNFNTKTEAQLLTEIDQLKTEVEKLKKFKTETQNTKIDSKLKNAEEVAKFNTDRFRDLVDSTDGIVWEADAQTFKFNFVSKKAERLLGFPIKDWYKDGFWASNIYEKDKVKTVNYCASQTKKKLPHDFEYRFVSKNGEIFWLRDIVNVVIKDGAPYKLRGIMVDITKLKHAELSLIESEEKFKEALEITRLGTFIFDDSTDLFETSSICDEIIGIDQSYIRDIQGWINFVHPEDYENAQLLLDKTNLDHVSSEFRIIRPKDKKVIWILGNAKKEYDHKGVRTKITGTIKDISKRKQAEINLRMSELRLREAQSVAQIGSFEGDIYNDELWWSDELFNLFGLKTNEFKITKDGFNQLIHPDEKEEYNSNLMSCLETGNPFKREFRGRHTSGEWRYFETVAGITHDCAGEILGMRGTVQDITDRIIAKKVLNDQKERYELAMDATKDGLYDWNIETNETYFSPGWKKMLGYQDDELPNEFSVWEKLTRPEDVKTTMKMLEELFNKQRDVFEIDFKMKHKSGRWVDVHSRANAFFNKTGKAIRLVGTHIDITERKLAELELIKAKEIAVKSEMYLDNIISNIGDPVFVKDDQSRLLLVNDSFCNLFKLTKTEIIGKTLVDEVESDERKNFLKIDKQVIANGQENINEELLTLKGEKSRFLSTKKNRFIDSDGNKFLIGTIRDITERKKIEISLKESEIRFRTIFENSPVLINAFDKDGKCILWNKQCEQTFGWTLNELNSHDNSLKLFYPNPEIQQEVLLSVTTNPDGNFNEWNPITKKGKKLTVMWANFILQDGLIYNIGYDITEQKLAELKLNRSNQLLEETQAITKLGGWELDIASNNLFWTKETYNIHDTTPEEFNPSVDAGVNYFLPDSRRIISKALEAAMTHGKGYDLKLETLTTKGRHIHVRTTCEVTCVEGKPTKLLGVFQDITESVLAEKSLRASAERFERWKSSNFIGILHSTAKGKIIDANDTMLDMIGYSKQDLIEERVSWGKLTPPEYLDLDQKAMEEAAEKGSWTPFEKEYYHKDGHRVPILIGGSVFLETNDEYIVFIIDLTERKLKEIELLKSKKEAQENETRFKALHNASFGGIAIHDKGVIMDCNKGLSIISGFSTEELIGMDGMLLIEESFRENVMANILADYEKPYEVVGTRKNNEVYPLRLEAREIPYKGKKVRIVEFRDISDQKQAELDLQNSNSLLSSILESPDNIIMFALDTDYNYLSFNQAHVREMKDIYDVDIELGKNISLFIPNEEDVRKAKINYKRVLKGERFIEIQEYGEADNRFWYELIFNPIYDEFQHVIGFTAFVSNITERKRAELELKEINERFNIAFNQQFVSMAILSPEGYTIEINDLPLKVQGVKREDCIGKLFWQSPTWKNSKEWQEKIKNNVMQAVSMKEPLFTEDVFFSKNGNSHNALAIYNTVRDAENNPLYVLVQAMDITERKLAEEKLIKSEKRFRSIMESASDSMLVVNNRGEIIHINKQLEIMTDYSSNELIGNRLEKLIPQRYNDHKQHRDKYNTKPQKRAMGKGMDLFILKKDGTEIPVEISLSPIETDEGPITLAVILDITERKISEEKIQESNKKYLNLMNSLGTGVVLHAADTSIILSNPKASEILGISIEQMEGKKAIDPRWRFVKNDGIELPLEEYPVNKVLRSMKSFSDYFIGINRPDRKDITWVNVNASPVFEENNIIKYITISFHDITVQKQAKDELEKYREKLEELVSNRTKELEEKNNELDDKTKVLSINNAELLKQTVIAREANKELEAFSYSVSHDLRAPLRHIDGFTNLLFNKNRNILDEKSKNYIDNIISSSKQMNTLIDDLLIFSRMGRKEVVKRKVSMNKLINTALETFTLDIKKNKISILIDDMPDVNVDASLLTQVWINLISNAIKFSNNIKKSKIHIGVDKDENQNTIYFIKDNGAGFNQKYVDKMFGVFQRLHNINEFPGTGIGLANVKRIIIKHNGIIWAKGEVDKGASFFFTLPNGKNIIS